MNYYGQALAPNNDDGRPLPPPPYAPMSQSSTNISPEQQLMWEWFMLNDRNRTGHLDVTQFQSALQNGEWPMLQHEAVRMIMNTFDPQVTGSIDFAAFQAAVKYVRDWFNCFLRFDTDKSGYIDKRELSMALKAFGFSVNDRAIGIIMRKYDKIGNGSIAFDDFIKCCVSVRSLTAGFMRFDAQRNGTAVMNYDEFIEIAFQAY